MALNSGQLKPILGFGIRVYKVQGLQGQAAVYGGSDVKAAAILTSVQINTFEPRSASLYSAALPSIYGGTVPYIDIGCFIMHHYFAAPVIVLLHTLTRAVGDQALAVA